MSESAPGKSVWRLIGESMLALVVGIVLAVLVQRIFGEEFATRQQALVYSPIAGFGYGEGSRDQLRVLLIDDAALVAAGQGWPAQYSYSARLLRAVSQYRPKAVFIDIYYAATREDASLPLLLQQLCRLKEQGTAVYLAATRNRTGAYALRPELEQLAGRCFEKVAVRYTPDAIDRMAWNYPLRQNDASNGVAVRSAALALYESGRAKLAGDTPPLALTWGSRAAHNGVGWVGDDGKSAYCRRSRGAADLWRSVIPASMYDDGEQPVCVYHETIRAGQLTSTTAEEDARLRQLIEGKVLMIGTALADSGDLVLSPIHGRIPGVYLHAMALDNLLTQGADYARDMPLSFDRRHAPLLLFLFVALAAVTLLPKLFDAWLLARVRRPWLKDPLQAVANRNWLRCRRVDPIAALAFLAMCALRVLLSLAVGALVLWVGQRFLGLGVLSIMGVIFLTMMAELFKFNQKLIKYLVPSSGPSPVSPHPSQEPSDAVVSEPV
ncbi:MAG TPA: CHASE2 domain-containing protein [Telluria sp.]